MCNSTLIMSPLSMTQKSGLRIPRRQVDRVGQLQHEQGACNSAEVLVGNDLCLRSLWKLRRLWRARQHMLHIQVNKMQHKNLYDT